MSEPSIHHLLFVCQNNGCSYNIKTYGVEIAFNGMTSLLNFRQTYQLVQKLIEGTDGQTHRQDDDLTNENFPLGTKVGSTG
jgi:hypothetical protein